MLCYHRYTHIEKPPTDAEAYGRLLFARIGDGSPCYVKAWRGKARKPYAYYRFRDAEHRAEWIEHEKRVEDVRQRVQQERAVERSARLVAMLERFPVGTILHYSWGYEQTNCEFYEVVERRGARTAIIREIASETVEGSEGFMSERRKPRPGVYIGKPMVKRIGPWGISMDHGSATPVEPGQTFHCSWYG